MASEMTVAFAIIFALLGIQSILVLGEGGVECEKLPVEMCAFAVSSSGARCVMQKKYSLVTTTHEASVQYQCQSSGIMAEKMMEWIDSEECLQACGLQRMSVSTSTNDHSSYSHFTSKLCSDKCQNSCPNVVDLYFNVAAAEGMHLPTLCKARKTSSRRMMYEAPPAPNVQRGLKASSLGGAEVYPRVPY